MFTPTFNFQHAQAGMPHAHGQHLLFEDYLREQRSLWVESELRLARVTLGPGLCPAFREHFMLGAHLLEVVSSPLAPRRKVKRRGPFRRCTKT